MCRTFTFTFTELEKVQTNYDFNGLITTTNSCLKRQHCYFDLLKDNSWKYCAYIIIMCCEFWIPYLFCCWVLLPNVFFMNSHYRICCEFSLPYLLWIVSTVFVVNSHYRICCGLITTACCVFSVPYLLWIVTTLFVVDFHYRMCCEFSLPYLLWILTTIFVVNSH